VFPRPWHFLAALSLLGGASLAAQENTGTALFYNGRFVLNDGKGGQAGALLVRNGRVIAAGDLAALSKRADAAGVERVDLGGATAVPGLQDGHVDLELLAFAQGALNLSGARSYAELVQIVAAQAARNKSGGWVLGFGWSERDWPDAANLHHAVLSSAVPDRPVLLLRRDGRAALVNKAALALAKLDGALTLDPRRVAGRVVEDADGRATGLLIEGAIDLVRRLVPESELGDVRQLGTRLQALQQQFLAQGVTAVHDMGTDGRTLTALRELRTAGTLDLRVICYLDGNEPFDALLAPEYLRADPLERLSVQGARFRLDGGLWSHSAALLEPYADLAHSEGREQRGQILMSDDVLAARLSELVRRDLQPAFEAQGDRANRHALDLLDRVLAVQGDISALRPRIEGALIVATKDWPRFPALHVVTSMQPAALADDYEAYAGLLGEARWRGLATWRALVPSLGRTVFGSGSPAHDIGPLRTLAAARLPLGGIEGLAPSGQSLNPAEALAACTSSAAWAARQEARRGRLQPGCAADMTVLSADPSKTPADQLTTLQVRMTVVDGRIVYRRR